MSDDQGRPLIDSPLRRRIDAGEVALGINVRLAWAGEIARIARATGHDFIYIDAQHGVLNVESIALMIQGALLAGVAPVVRVRSSTDPDISRHLDAGALGIVVPDVDSAGSARRAVEATKYLPVGKRSIGGMSVHLDYRTMMTREFTDASNAATLLICMIESQEGLANVEEIGAVDGVDGLYLGMGDMLLTSPGYGGRVDSPAMLADLERLIDVARRNGKFAGCGGPSTVEQQVDFIRRGVRFLSTQSDLAAVLQAMSARIGQIRQLL